MPQAKKTEEARPSYEELIAQVKQLKRKNEAAERAEQEAKRARQEAEQGRQEAERGRQELENSMRKTNFDECVTACHRYLQPALRVQTNPDLVTTGHTTSVKLKLWPGSLKPWKSFEKENAEVFNKARGFLHPLEATAPRFLNSLKYFEELGEDLSFRRYGSEKDLEVYQRIAVEDIVAKVVNRLSTEDGAKEALGLSRSIVFENHFQALGENAKEVIRETQNYTPGKVVPSKSRAPGQRAIPDQYCTFTEIEGGSRRLLFVSEYKPPHKLSLPFIYDGFRPMTVSDIFGRLDIPLWTEPPTNGEQLTAEEVAANEERLKYDGDLMCATVGTQVFDAMIKFGMEYSYITTGEALIFLRILEDDPTTLYYHVAVPKNDISVRRRGGLPLHKTAVGQVLGLCLMSVASSPRGDEWRDDAIERLSQGAVEDLDEIWGKMVDSQRKHTPYRGPKPKPIKRDAYPIRSKKTCGKLSEKRRDDFASGDDDDDDDDDENREEGGSTLQNDTPIKPSGRSTVKGDQSKTEATSDKAEQQAAKLRIAQEGRLKRRSRLQFASLYPYDPTNDPYCTQACLLGLKTGSALDPHCPNFQKHDLAGGGGYHSINAREFTQQVQRQLDPYNDQGGRPLSHLHGSRGQLFKIKLLSLGYVFLGKGTVDVFAECLEYEASIYGHLEKLQGRAIPVCFDVIKLARECYYLPGIIISHMLLLSWAGDRFSENDTVPGRDRLVEEVRAAGVCQGDVRTANMLWNRELGRAVLIDFERASLLSQSDDRRVHGPPRRVPLAAASMNTRGQKRKASGTEDASRSVKQCVSTEGNAVTSPVARLGG